MKIHFNSPVILSFSLIATLIMALKAISGAFFIQNIEPFFAAPGQFNWDSLAFYTGILFHPLAHGDWGHLLGNFSMILLLGPILEEKYGSSNTIMMILVTALLTGILNALIFDSGLIGASGIVFMLILLSSFSNVKAGNIPLTFILVAFLFLGKEIYSGLIEEDNISQFGHIMGGVLGAAFGFLMVKDK